MFSATKINFKSNHLSSVKVSISINPKSIVVDMNVSNVDWILTTTNISFGRYDEHFFSEKSEITEKPNAFKFSLAFNINDHFN